MTQYALSEEGPVPIHFMDDATTQPVLSVHDEVTRPVTPLTRRKTQELPVEEEAEVTDDMVLDADYGRWDDLRARLMTPERIARNRAEAEMEVRGIHPQVEKVELTREFFNETMSRAADHMQLENDFRELFGRGLDPHEKLSERALELAKAARLKPSLAFFLVCIGGLIGAAAHLMATR